MRLTAFVAVTGLVAFWSAAVHAGGFEKATMMSGHYSGFGGAASAVVNDAESLYFNPAGLSFVHGWNFSVNGSPTLSQFKGPIVENDKKVDGKKTLIAPFSAVGAYGITDRWSVGGGVYVSGGARATFEDVDFSALNPAFKPELLAPKVESNLSITELGLGTGYEVWEGLRVGGTWRAVMVRGSLASTTYAPAPTLGARSAVLAVEANELKKTRYDAFRLGAQYSPRDAFWGVGVTWRSPVAFTATGKSEGKIMTAAPSRQDLTGGPVAVSNSFPQQLTVGGYYDVRPRELRLLGEYNWTQYSKNQNLNISGSVTLPAGIVAGTPYALPISNIPQDWKNENNFRAGVEYAGFENWLLRGGYVLTSAVVRKDRARPTFSTPGWAHTFTAGAGTKLMHDLLMVNGAFEYSFASANVPDTSVPVGGQKYGDYSSAAYVAHLGVTYSL